MKLEDIGFYTLSDNRAMNASEKSDLQRCELILTDKCNFKCAYCRGIKNNYCGDISMEDAMHIVNLWCSNNLRNIRFSGGEPTLWRNLVDLVKHTKSHDCIRHIALSTNGSASLRLYDELLSAGVNDFSISLDACCASTANKMAGVNGKFEHISTVIKYLSERTYCTVGVVLDNRNIDEIRDIINYSTKLGVSDIRIIPSAQDNRKLNVEYETEYPILKYRLNNIKKGRHVRGLKDSDCGKCHLVKDDMVVLHGYHFPCIIYMREQGDPIERIFGKTMGDIREERKQWFKKTNCHMDRICKHNCLDVCIDYNNRVE